MECVIGIVGKDFVLVASDTQQAHSIVVMKNGILIIFKSLINPIQGLTLFFISND